MKKRVWWIIGIALVLVVAGFYTYRTVAAKNAAAAANLQTATVGRGNVTSIISSAGTVRSNQNATIAWQTTGKVGTLSAQLGQQVKVNDVLASLDPNSLPQNIIQAQSDLIDAQTALDNLQKPQALAIAQAEAALEDAKTAQQNLLHPSQTAISQAQVAVNTAQTAVENAQKTVNQVKGKASQQQINTARADLLLAQAKVDQMQGVYDRTSGDPETNVQKATALSNLSAAQAQRDHAQAMLNWYLGPSTQEQIDDATSKLALAQAQLVDAQTALSKLQDPSQADINLAQAKVDDAQQTLDNLKNGPTVNDITKAQTKVILAQAALNEARVTAPITGTITDIQVMPGDIVSAGKVAFRIDDLSRLFIDMTVSEIDVSSIQVGQTVQITFDAIANKEYTGVVIKVGIVGTVSQGVVNYPVTVQITNPDANVRPGMTAAANIVIAEHDNVLVLPNQAIQTSGTRHTVTVLFEGQQIQIPVTVGLTSATTSEVTGNQLKEGDTVLLNSSVASTTSAGRNIRGGFGFGGFGP